MPKRKQSLCCLVLVAALLAMLLAQTAFAAGYTYFTESEQTAYAMSCLTEVYGYRNEEAESFVFENTEADGIATLRYWPGEHPEWVYKATFSLTDGQILTSESPFHSSYAGYPGENSVRFNLTKICEQELLSNWGKASRDAFKAILDEDGFKGCAALEKGLLSADYTASEAVRDYFVSCYGEPDEWSRPVSQWCSLLLEGYGLTLPEASAVPEKGVIRYRSETEKPYMLTEFCEAVPPELAEAFAHPKLEGWQILSGACVLFEEYGAGYGLTAFGKGAERILCVLTKEKDTDWQVLPAGENALPEGCSVEITRLDPLSSEIANRYRIRFESETCKDGEMQVSVVYDGGRVPCLLKAFSFTDAETGNTYTAKPDDGLYLFTCKTTSGQVKEQLLTDCTFTADLMYLELDTLTAAMKAPAQADGFRLPEGTVILTGVHLRKETSSRSKDLGMLNAGTMAKKLGTERGDPHSWYHVQIGSLTGYVSSVYVDETLTRSVDTTIPVAVAQVDTILRSHTGLLAENCGTITKGDSMHIILEDGSWYYVCVPIVQPACKWMDPNGTYGYIRKDEVTVGNSVLQLEWQEALTK